ncbi:MAG: zf-HC2 domain-containing protein [Gemmatimonadaceae bacterium]
MTDCTNETMRDLLPLMAHDVLGVHEAARAREHLATCPDCAAELALLRAASRVFAAATPAVDPAAIVRSLPSPPVGAERAAARPPLRVERTRRAGRANWMPRRYLAAAASLLIVGTLSLTVLERFYGERTGVTAGSDGTTADSGRRAGLAVPVDLLGAIDLADLGADELTAFLVELDGLEATVAAEPITMRQPLVAAPEGI